MRTISISCKFGNISAAVVLGTGNLETFKQRSSNPLRDRNPWYPFSFPKDGNPPATAITKYWIIPLQLSVTTLLGLGNHISFQKKLKTMVPFSRCISSVRSHRSVLLQECLSSVCNDFPLDVVIIFQHSLFIFEQERRGIKRYKPHITLFKTKPSRTAHFSEFLGIHFLANLRELLIKSSFFLSLIKTKHK